MKINVKKIQDRVDSFNKKYSAGDKVKIKRPDGIFEATVSNPATILGGHSAVGWFEEFSGCYDLDFIIE
jgi:hypothetical protein